MTRDQLLATLRESIGAVLREKHGKGKVLVPSSTLDGLIEEIARNTAAPLWMAIEEQATELRALDIEHESLHHKLTQAGAKSGALDAMLTSVLERGRASIAAREAADQLVHAADAVLVAVNERHIDTDGTDESAQKIIDLAAARTAARRELGTKERS